MKLSRACRRRVNQLDRLINTSRQVRTAWGQERAYILATGRLDWVDPNPMHVYPASHDIQPPPPRER